jgi:hypothetical protein
MDVNKKINGFFMGSLLGLAVAFSLGSTGCTVFSNGMTLPNPYYMNNHVQYFPRGSEFPLPNEAAHMQESQHDTNY